MAHNFRSLIIWILALFRGLNLKQVGAASGFRQKRVSRILASLEIEDEVFERLLAGVKGRPVEVGIVTACLEALQAVEQAGDLTEEELAAIEEAARGSARLTREGFTAALRRFRLSPGEGDPEVAAVVSGRGPAVELRERLKRLSKESGPPVAQAAEDFQRWVLCEAVCEQSVREASRDVAGAASWARLAREIAEQERGPERDRLRGYAAAHEANILRVAGQLKEAEVCLKDAKRLWQSGPDPYGVLDPGRLLHFEAALRRAERRFDEALILLDQAAGVSYPERALVSKGFTLEVMGEYERAIDSLLQALPLVQRQEEPRDRTVLLFNLAVNFCHVGQFTEAAELVPKVRDLATALGGEIDLIRLIWLEGRIAAGLGRTTEARRLLAEARMEFAARGMAYDVALALLEEAVLLLQEDRTAEVKALAAKLTRVFEDKGVHREALAALRLFHEAAEREEATAELARRVLCFLFRARHDQGLRFES
jgi:tetratricopeptide (TPR) repeat protein